MYRYYIKVRKWGNLLWRTLGVFQFQLLGRKKPTKCEKCAKKNYREREMRNIKNWNKCERRCKETKERCISKGRWWGEGRGRNEAREWAEELWEREVRRSLSLHLANPPLVDSATLLRLWQIFTTFVRIPLKASPQSCFVLLSPICVPVCKIRTSWRECTVCTANISLDIFCDAALQACVNLCARGRKY